MAKRMHVLGHKRGQELTPEDNYKFWEKANENRHADARFHLPLNCDSQEKQLERAAKYAAGARMLQQDYAPPLLPELVPSTTS